MSVTNEKQTVRLFRKHRTFGEVWAIAVLADDVKLTPVGGYRCTKPEEQTRGALPVIALDFSPEMVEFLEDNAADMELWEPPRVPAELLEQIVAAGRIADEAERRMKAKKTAADAAKKEWEASAQDLQRLVRQAAAETPLFDAVADE